ncbi:Fe/S biogenesis protein NfuA [Candidatus Johnevansia muelleri]|uniref:Fe/S biogenesis protein NfuA n=1 Tax=Candidatus Johnevansia muelleri TaxID=1495769 RepID=A0A078KI10_9GAMM|nr:Fe/S biogenesis protein NfuA [Candidatus Evansia muelleri]
MYYNSVLYDKKYKNIKITFLAQKYISDILFKKNIYGISVRVFVIYPGTPNVETCLVYCSPGEEEINDIKIQLKKFNLYIEKKSLPFLNNAVIDFNTHNIGGNIIINAPNTQIPYLKTSTLENKVNYVLYNEINPQLAIHQGGIKLINITNENVVLLKFTGGCQGCNIVNITLKNNVERTLLERIPELTGVIDITDHTDNINSWNYTN